MTAMRVNGVVSTAYGIFEWDEGIQKQELGNIGDVTADTFNFGSDVICFGYDGVYHTIGEVSVFISKLEVSNVLWGYATRAFNSVTGTIKGLTKGIVWRKNVVGGAQGGYVYTDDIGNLYQGWDPFRHVNFKKSDIRMVNDAANQVSVDRIIFGEYIHEVKRELGMKANQNFTYQELLELAEELLRSMK